MADLKHVLIVNDDSGQREKLCAIVEGLCTPVVPETHAALLAELAGLKAHPDAFALVILDYLFEFWEPREAPLNGRDVLEHWLRAPDVKKAMPVIFITNFPDEALVAELRQKPDVYVAKFGETSSGQLYDWVEALLEQA